MDPNSRLLMMGTGGGAIVNPVGDYFSTDLYAGDQTAKTINNGLNMLDGGLIWIKERSSGQQHFIVDSSRGYGRVWHNGWPNSYDQNVYAGSITATTTGFSLSADPVYGNACAANSSGNVVAWCWRKVPRFFDVVQWTGNGVSGRAISHNLQVQPALVIIRRKMTSGGDTAYAYHVNNFTGQAWDFGSATDSITTGINVSTSTFTVYGTTDGTGGQEGHNNVNGYDYIAYLFANDTASDGVIRGGLATGGTSVNLGWAPQWVMLRSKQANRSWEIYDTARGLATGINSDKSLTTLGNGETTVNAIEPLSNGFSLPSSYWASENIMYLAVRAE